MRDIALVIVVLWMVPRILKRPFWGLILWVVFSLMNPHRLTWGFAYELPFAQFIALLTLASLVLNSKTLYPFPINGVTVSMILLVLWINVSSLLGQDSYLEHILWLRAIKVMIMVMITFWAVGKREEIHYLAWALALSIGLYGIKGGLFTIRFGGGERVWGPPGTFISDNNALALAIVMAVPLFRYLQLHSQQRWLRIACVGAMLLCVASAAGSQSRGALLAMAGMGIFLWLKSPNKLVLGLAGIIVAIAVYMNMPESWHARMSTIGTYEQDQSAMGRINAWWMTWNLAVDRFPIGGGFDLYTWENFGRYAPDPRQVLAAHSIYFQILGEHGFIGLAIFLSIFIGTWRCGSWIIKQAKKHPDLHWMRDLAGMCQVSLVGYAVGGAFLSLSYYDFPYYVAAMLVITRGLAAQHLEASQQKVVHETAQQLPRPRPTLQKLHMKRGGAPLFLIGRCRRHRRCTRRARLVPIEKTFTMTQDTFPAGAAAPADQWDTSSHEDFFSYYAQQSLSEKTMERFRLVTEMLLRQMEGRVSTAPLEVLDIGCGVGTQSKFWLQRGHHYRGIDINRPLIELACRRAGELGLEARFDVGSATELPVATASMDVCLLPELLEHVADWKAVIAEAARVLRPGGLIYISTSNRLCPLQEEFNLPLYSWYPAPLKRYFERRASTDWPALVNHATYPAVHWFSYYMLRDHLAELGFRSRDRFDLIDPRGRSAKARAVLALLRNSALLRWLGQVTTPYTVVLAVKQPAGEGAAQRKRAAEGAAASSVPAR